jgi:polynucleotide 5'-hydroxyl-kinase GRC3/NOL9
MKLEVEKGKTAIVRGSVRIEGDAEIVGGSVKSFTTQKYIPVYCRGDCKMEVNGDYILLDHDTIPKTWRELAEKDWETLFIYGGVDSGKSTLATFLANKSNECCVLDLDIGQSDIVHPAAMGYGIVDREIISLSQIRMFNGVFVGTISPAGRESRCLRGVAKLWKEIKSMRCRKIIDTTGWMRGRRAREYKLAKVEIIQPDVIASFEGKPDFFEGYEVFELEKGFTIERSREERARIRIEKYQRWLESAGLIEIDVREIRLSNTNLMKGKRIPKEFIEDILETEILFVERGQDFLNICTAKRAVVTPEIIRGLRELYEVEDISIFCNEDLTGLIVGLYGGMRREKYLGFGLIRSVDFDLGKMVIETSNENFNRVEFGEIRFDGEKEYIVRTP